MDDLGVNMLDYGARMYMPDLGRWTAVDPLAGEREWLSPYNYVQNNPLLKVDPDGKLDIFYINNDGTVERVEQEGPHEYHVQSSSKNESQNDYTLVATLSENSNGLVEFPGSGDGFSRYGTSDAGGVSGTENVGSGDHYVTPETAAVLYGVVGELENDIALGDMSSSNGSDPWQSGFSHHAGHGHNGNRSGLDVDFRYQNDQGGSIAAWTSGDADGNAFNESNFSQSNNQSIYNVATKYGFTINYHGSNGAFNNSSIATGHNDHGHIGRANNNSNITTINQRKPSRYSTNPRRN